MNPHHWELSYFPITIKETKKIYKQTVNEKIQSKTEETLIEYLPHNKEVAF